MLRPSNTKMYYLVGVRIMIIRRPSMFGLDSILATSSKLLASRNNNNSPFSVYNISRPRN